jgi:glucose-1-phosphate adenylyltransferase
MDFRKIIEQHIETHADLTIATMPVARPEASSLGIMHIDSDRRISQFVEKPKDPALLDTLRLDRASYPKLGIMDERELFLASMGIYVFNREVVVELLNNTLTDFGKHIIPNAMKTHRVFSYVYQGYWEDIGTIRAFFEANLDVTSELPRFNFFDMSAPVFSRPRFLPGSKINGAQIDHAVVSDGCIINHARIAHTIVGVRSLVDLGSELKRVIILGCDYYETQGSVEQCIKTGRPRLGIGQNTRIENAIIDKNARIGDNVVISPAGKPENLDHPLYFIRDGIVIIPKNGVIPHGTVI